MEWVKMDTALAISHFVQNRKHLEELHKGRVYLINLLKEEQYSLAEVVQVAREAYRKNTGRELPAQFCQIPQKLPAQLSLPTQLFSTLDKRTDDSKESAKMKKKLARKEEKRAYQTRLNQVKSAVLKRRNKLLSKPAELSETYQELKRLLILIREHEEPGVQIIDRRGNIVEY